MSEKHFKWYMSFQKERKWLEEMALQGKFLKNMSMGVFYTFETGEPRRMLYDIDRFTISKKPTLEEIRRKEIFFEMAKDMGWKEATHDETMTYYFTKEWVEGDINELHNDEESRAYRAKKYSLLFMEQVKSLLLCVAAVLIMNIIVQLCFLEESDFANIYNWFALIYGVFGSIYSVWVWKLSVKTEKELSMSREEWEASVDTNTHKKVRKLILTNRGLNKFLVRQQQEGWVLESVTPFTYVFKKSVCNNQIYTMDSAYLVKKRCENRKDVFEDSKDWYAYNNDWQLQSVKDAEEKGWEFVCALENRSIIYRGTSDKVTALNDGKYDNSLRFVSIVGKFGLLMLVSFLVGLFIGWLSANMSLF